jgi:sialate O-acetylesterase
MDLPATWQQRGVPGNGVVWFRRTVDAPAGWAGRDAVLRLGAADKHDVTYVNGEQVGATGWETDTPWCVSRVYRVPGRLIRPGRNVVSSRVYSFRNAGGLVGPSDDMRLDLADGPAGGAISLAGAWRYAIEHDFGVIRATDQPELMPDQNSPYALFDSMIAPLAPYALRGFLWYQGESNAAEADLYRTRFPLLIRDWRRAWGQAQLPFLFVQLANYVSVPAADGSSNWARLRHAQALALREPATGMAVAIDIGDPQDIHPRNKQEVGRRLELAAEAVAYGRPVVASGPVYQSTKIAAGAAGAAHVRFTHVGSGLVARTLFSPTGLPLAALDNPAGQGAGRGGQPGQAEKVLGFAIAGEDRRFVPADARIEGDTVIVSSSQVPRPAAVRYGWADAPVCNLYNGDLLPACPFRTDEW